MSVKTRLANVESQLPGEQGIWIWWGPGMVGLKVIGTKNGFDIHEPAPGLTPMYDKGMPWSELDPSIENALSLDWVAQTEIEPGSSWVLTSNWGKGGVYAWVLEAHQIHPVRRDGAEFIPWSHVQYIKGLFKRCREECAGFSFVRLQEEESTSIESAERGQGETV